MKNVSRFVVGLTFVGALVAAGARPVLAQDPVKVAPDKCKVLFENDVVRVYEFTLKPGEKMPMHSHPQTSIYSLTDSKLTITVAGGKPESAEFKAGQAYYHGPVTHGGVNTGTTDTHLIITEIKGPHSMTQK
jgi:quercetin dioxygenase-like cupin family protein